MSRELFESYSNEVSSASTNLLTIMPEEARNFSWPELTGCIDDRPRAEGIETRRARSNLPKQLALFSGDKLIRLYSGSLMELTSVSGARRAENYSEDEDPHGSITSERARSLSKNWRNHLNAGVLL